MKQYRLLILTEHTNHSAQNSLYALANAMLAHPLCKSVDIATRGNINNHSFFAGQQAETIEVTSVNKDFRFEEGGLVFLKNKKTERIDSYELVWLRLPPPLGLGFLDFLTSNLKGQFVFNNPTGIFKTGSKEFLMNFPEICPPMKICYSLKDIVEFKTLHPIVLKPFREYGGKGIVRIDRDKVMDGKTEMTFQQFADNLMNKEIAYLGVKFLKNVSKGDKRIVVVNGKIMGSSLRLPPPASWLCNVAMGGTSVATQVEKEEKEIVNLVNPTLSKLGIVMYGVDTLVGDDGKRVLSEINTTSIGGIPQMAKQQNLPLVEKTVDSIWDYFLTKKH